jgi:hypothetical protein
MFVAENIYYVVFIYYFSIYDIMLYSEYIVLWYRKVSSTFVEWMGPNLDRPFVQSLARHYTDLSYAGSKLVYIDIKNVLKYIKMSAWVQKEELKVTLF